MALVLVAGLAVTGCGDDSSELPDPPASPPSVAADSGTLELTAEEEQAVEEARAVFDDFMTAYNEILTAGEPATDAVLNRIIPYLLYPLQVDIHSEIFDNFQGGYRADGQIEWSFVEVVDTDLEAVSEVAGEERPSPTIRMRYCVDRTKWATVERDTGEVVGEPGSRHYVVITAILFDSTPVPVPAEELDPVWGISVWEDQADKPC